MFMDHYSNWIEIYIYIFILMPLPTVGMGPQEIQTLLKELCTKFHSQML